MLNIEKKYTYSGSEIPFDGITSQVALRKTPLLEMLGLELIARLNPSQRLKMSRDAFVLLARSQNDSSACMALEMVYTYTVLSKKESPFSTRLSVEEFHAKRREEEKKFFDWLESVYWTLPLYNGSYWEERTNGSLGFQLENPLAELRKRVVGLVASRIWDGKDDELGVRAFNFVAACTNSALFCAKATETTKAVQEYKKRYHFDKFGRLRLPEKDIKAALDAIRAAVPSKVDDIRRWIRRKPDMPIDVWKIFAHAYVNAGGDITD